jgi:hypothetical protein
MTFRDIVKFAIFTFFFSWCREMPLAPLPLDSRFDAPRTAANL